MSTLEKSIYVFLISILPIIELRGAIPAGAALGLPFYIYAPLSILGNLLPVPFILLFIPKILDLLERVRIFRPVVRWVREKARKGARKILEGKKKDAAEQATQDASASHTGENGSEHTALPSLTLDDENAASTAAPTAEDTILVADAVAAPKMTLGIFLALLLFVMIPLPGTGAWTGALVASLFEFPKKHSFLAITLGVLGASVIMTLASEGVVSIFRFFL